MDYSELLASIGQYAAIVAFGYVYFAVMLTLIAGKTGTPGAWMAWLPIANILLMCRVAKKPGWFVFLLLIPVVNLFVFVALWMGIAKARGRSAALGLLILVPIANLIMMLLLALGPANPASAPRTGVCPACGRPECMTEEFCGYTGQRIAASRPVVPAAGPAPSGAIATAIIAMLLTAGVGYLATVLFSSARSSDGRKAGGNLPKAVAGRMTEFPVDTAAAPARPSSVATRVLRPGANRRIAGPPPSSLPPRVTPDTLARVGETVTTATYQTAPQDPPVNVHVIDKFPGGGADSESIAQASAYGGDQVTRVRVESPKGGTYTGYRVNSAQAVTIILDKDSGGIMILIHAGSPSVKATAERLAANVGNGGGLLEDPDIGPEVERQAGSVPPAGFDLVESQAYFGANVDAQIEELKRSAGVRLGPEADALVAKAKSVLPSRMVHSVYRDGGRGEFRSIIGDYGSGWKAMSVWLLLRATAGLNNSGAVSIRGGDGISLRQDGKDYVLFRRGGCLGVIEAPLGQATRAAQLGEAVTPGS
jgi:hypothetical protein